MKSTGGSECGVSEEADRRSGTEAALTAGDGAAFAACRCRPPRDPEKSRSRRRQRTSFGDSAFLILIARDLLDVLEQRKMGAVSQARRDACAERKHVV